MNAINLIGRLTKDPERKESANGTVRCNFRLAVNRPYAKDGQQSADFFDCVVFGKRAEIAYRYCAKGTQLGIVGRMQINQTHKNGEYKVYPSVVVDSFDFCGSSKGKEKKQSNQPTPPENSETDDYLDDEFFPMDDDVPF